MTSFDHGLFQMNTCIFGTKLFGCMINKVLQEIRSYSRIYLLVVMTLNWVSYL